MGDVDELLYAGDVVEEFRFDNEAVEIPRDRSARCVLGNHDLGLQRIAAVDADLVVIGHTHAQLVQRVGRPLVISPGSAGQARDASNGRRLSHAVLDTASGEVEIDDYSLD